MLFVNISLHSPQSIALKLSLVLLRHMPKHSTALTSACVRFKRSTKHELESSLLYNQGRKNLAYFHMSNAIHGSWIL